MRIRYMFDPFLSTSILVLAAIASFFSNRVIWFIAACVVMAIINFGREIRRHKQERLKLTVINSLIVDILDTGEFLLNDLTIDVKCSLWLPTKNSMCCRYKSHSNRYDLDTSTAVPISSRECVCRAYSQRKPVFVVSSEVSQFPRRTDAWRLAVPIVDVEDNIKVLGILRVDGNPTITPEKLEKKHIDKKAAMIANQLSRLLSTADRIY